LQPSKSEHVTLSCDRPDIHLVAWPIQYPINTFHNLVFLVDLPPDFVDGITPLPAKFLVFSDSTKVAKQALHVACTILSLELHKNIRYFHAGMT
ncbi:hypothetical protein FIBSPDRAFT_759614, partial [Athelia psychrophila]